MDSCIKPVDLFVLRSTIITRGHNLKLFKAQCSLDVRKYSFLLTGLSISGTACQVTLLSASSISVFKHKLEFVDGWSSLRPVCFIVMLFSFVGHASVSFGTCVSRLV